MIGNKISNKQAFDVELLRQLSGYLVKSWRAIALITILVSAAVFVLTLTQDERYQSTALLYPWKSPVTLGYYTDFELETIINSPPVQDEIRRAFSREGKEFPPRIRIYWLPGATMLSVSTISDNAEQSQRVLEIGLSTLFNLLNPDERDLAKIQQEQSDLQTLLTEHSGEICLTDDQEMSDASRELQYKLCITDRIRALDVENFTPGNQSIVQAPSLPDIQLPNRAILLMILSAMAVPLASLALLLTAALLKVHVNAKKG